MEWSEEKYVKLYQRDTVTWLHWPWQARALWPQLMRKLDGAGLLECGRVPPAAAIAIVVLMPLEVVEVGLRALFESGTLERVEKGILAPNFLAGQEARKSDSLRARESRERRRTTSLASNPPIPVEPPSHAVTARHTESQPVTLQPSPAQPSPSPAQPSPTPKEAKKTKEESPAHEIQCGEWTSAEDFWHWFQSLRVKAGCVREALPNGRKLSTFWSEALMELNGESEPLRLAVFRYGEDKHWQAATPPCPWQAFASEWRRYVPRRIHNVQ